MTERLEAREGNIICPGYDNHKQRVLDDGEMFSLTDSGEAVCDECREKWLMSASINPPGFYPQED